MPIGGVAIAQHHGERFMATDPLDGRQIDASRHQICDRRMAHDVRCQLGRVEPCPFLSHLRSLMGYDEPETLSQAINSICPIGADGAQSKVGPVYLQLWILHRRCPLFRRLRPLQPQEQTLP